MNNSQEELTMKKSSTHLKEKHFDDTQSNEIFVWPGIWKPREKALNYEQITVQLAGSSYLQQLHQATHTRVQNSSAMNLHWEHQGNLWLLWLFFAKAPAQEKVVY